MIGRVVRAPARCVALVRISVHVVLAVPLVAQQPAQTPPLAPYRAPAIALVQPPGGGIVPQDKPVVVFRFAAGEPSDPLDVATFRVAVDGTDQSARFQVAASEAWGPIGTPNSSGSAAVHDAILPGAHQILARICSSRGACAEASAMLTVIPIASPAQTRPPEGKRTRKERVTDALLTAVKKLLPPR